MKRKAMRVLTLMLAFAILFHADAYAAMPHPNYVQNSDYISDYEAWVDSPGNYVARIMFDVSALVVSDKVGVLTAVLQKTDDGVNVTDVYTFYSANYPNMIKENVDSNYSFVSKTVEHDHYYRATLIIYVENNGGSDWRQCTTGWVYI